MIGSGKVDIARTASWWHGSIFVVTAAFNVGLESLLVWLSGKYLTHDPAVRSATFKSIPFVAIFPFFDAIATWTHGIVRALGWQQVGGIASLVGMYLWGVPLVSLTLLDVRDMY
jgi:multidrug resistance protein, MATE family